MAEQVILVVPSIFDLWHRRILCKILAHNMNATLLFSKVLKYIWLQWNGLLYTSTLSLFKMHCRKWLISTVLITKTCLCNFDPLKPHFYIVKLGFTGVYIIFLISAQNIDCGYSLEPPRRGGSNEYPQSMFLSRSMKNIRIFIWKFSVFGGEIFNIFQ